MPLPHIETILTDIGHRKIFGKINITNSFFQAQVYSDNIILTTVNTLFSIYKWTVIPIGETNAPATHQQYMILTLLLLIWKIYHVYIDDIIIWSSLIKKHMNNIQRVLQALRKAQLYCLPKKTKLFALEINFLKHVILAKDICIDSTKINQILD